MRKRKSVVCIHISAFTVTSLSLVMLQALLLQNFLYLMLKGK